MLTIARKSELKIDGTHGSLQAIGWHVGVHSYAWSPPTDVYETEVSFVVRIEVAGMRESDFNVEIDDNSLVISGIRADSSEHRAYRQMEIRYGEFSSGVEIPSGLDVQHAEANYEDGFLVIIFPKLKPLGISVQG